MPQDHADEALMSRYAAGDVRAFESLYARHVMRIWRFIRRSVGDAALADDLMQDVWFTVAREASRYRPKARFTTWLFTLARNRIIDHVRATRRQALMRSADPQAGLDALAADPADEPLRRALSAEDAAALLAAVEGLPFEQREAFLLSAEGELSMEEIATVTHVSFETAKSRLRYARARLRRSLQEYA
jgi:RNA polymerase sigma-70 factor (ECF subfamily)